MADSTDIRDEGRPDEVEPGPDGPTELSRPSLKAVVLRTVKEFQKDNITDWAAALTYYAVLSVFPALIVLVALLGLFGQPDTLTTLIDVVRQLAPSAADSFEGAIRPIVAEKGTAGALLGVGMVGAIWTASGYVGAFIRATNAIYEVDEGRPFYKLYPLQMALTVAMLLLLAVVAIALAISGPVAEAIGGVLGLGDLAVTVWGIAKWPVILMIVIGIFAVLYHVSPNVRPPRFRWFTPGGARRRPRVDPRVGRLRGLRGELLLLQRHLRVDRRGHRLLGLAVDLQSRLSVRGGAERGGRAGAGARGRAAGAGRHPASVPGRPEPSREE
ncbi:MAG: YihY/virulence factor BrkB family protein [Thermoleophilaceae bacterium]